MSGAQLQSPVSLDAEALYESLRGELDEIDLARDLNERDTPDLMVALGVSACSGDEQTIADDWVKLGILVERGVITGDEWRSMWACVETCGP